jgi:hypothetical protein
VTHAAKRSIREEGGAAEVIGVLAGCVKRRSDTKPSIRTKQEQIFGGLSGREPVHLITSVKAVQRNSSAGRSRAAGHLGA